MDTSQLTSLLAYFGQNLTSLGVFALLGFGGFVIVSFLKSNTVKLKETFQSNIDSILTKSIYSSEIIAVFNYADSVSKRRAE